MSLSYCSNWGTAQCLNPEISCSFQQVGKELAGDYLSVSGSDSSLADLLDTFTDPFFQPGELIYSESDIYTNLLHCLSSPPSENMTSFLHEESEFYHCYDPECQKNFPNYYCSNVGPDFITGNDLAAPAAIEFLQEIPAPFPEFELPEYDMSAASNWGRRSENVKKAGAAGQSQSIAARERRRKISEKTQELGKLIPGAHKMNTAQMLQAAYKYVQFLQAQVGVLKAIWSVNDKVQVDKKEALLMQSEEVGVLLASTAIEEKLYSEEKCLVPIDLANRGYL